MPEKTNHCDNDAEDEKGGTTSEWSTALRAISYAVNT